MLKRSYYLTTLIAVITPLFAALVRSQSIVPTRPIEPQMTGEQQFSPTMPICYIQLENGQVRDLRSVCGKKATSPIPSRGVQRTLSQPDSDDGDDDLAPTPTSQPQITPSQTPSDSKPTPQSTPVKPLPQATSSPTTIQSPSASPSTVAPTTPNPLAIPEDKSSRD